MPAARPDLLPLRDSLLREIAAGSGKRRFPAHTVLIHEGDVADSLFVLFSGRVKVYAAHASGREVVLRTLGPGDYFGELAFDGGARSASVVTLEPCTCAVVSGARLRQFVAEHPDFALHLIHDLMHRVRSLTDSVKRLALDDVHGRVVGLLRDLAVADGDVQVVAEKLTQRDIAERVGASREMIGRIFKQLQASGQIELRRGRIVLLKPLPAR